VPRERGGDHRGTKEPRCDGKLDGGLQTTGRKWNEYITSKRSDAILHKAVQSGNDCRSIGPRHDRKGEDIGNGVMSWVQPWSERDELGRYIEARL
jgi:hypothetical protein